ncbi:MAG: DUF116 domain-containing protein [Betaproteobacteria bacterium]|nr:DUF116 domain-containing protein [Betaproteobacteria bacterium]
MNDFAEKIPVADSGLRSGFANHAIDRLWLAEHATGQRGAALRFYRSLPTASIGLHQAAERELRLDYCARRGIDVARRATGGGALYLDPDQLGFSLVLRRPRAWEGLGLQDLLFLFCAGIANGLRQLGIDARFKRPNDLEVAGRKIASAFCGTSRKSVLLQGVVLLEADVKSMLEALRAPTEKLSADGLAAARERLITVRECQGTVPDPSRIRAALRAGLSSTLGLEFRSADWHLSGFDASLEAVGAERAHATTLDWTDAADSAIEALWRTPEATLRARAEIAGGLIERLELAGDIHIHPPALLKALEDELGGLAVDLAPEAVEEFFCRNGCDILGAASRDFSRLLQLLAEKHRLQGKMRLDRDEANSLMVVDEENLGPAQIVDRAGVMLVPYCAKPLWCKWRGRNECPECGLCEVGEAYALAREKGLAVHTITSYEHLVTTLKKMQADGVKGYLGMCCSHFFVKRHRAFREAGMPALLMDISGANCYELKQEEAAYAGKFQAQAEINLNLLQKVMHFVPPAAARQSAGGIAP